MSLLSKVANSPEMQELILNHAESMFNTHNPISALFKYHHDEQIDMAIRRMRSRNETRRFFIMDEWSSKDGELK